MAELYRHTDEDGDSLQVLDAIHLGGWNLAVLIGDEKGWRSAVSLDRDAALRLAAALLSYYGPRSEEISEEKDDHA